MLQLFLDHLNLSIDSFFLLLLGFGLADELDELAEVAREDDGGVFVGEQEIHLFNLL
jgi:hypothetical protein